MSEIGDAQGYVATASEFRDLFIRDGIRLRNFVCPFCKVPLIAKAIYMQELQARSPHFAVWPGKEHLYGCNGMPQIETKDTETPPRHTFEKQYMDIPEELVLRPNSAFKRSRVSTQNKPSITEEDVRQMRNSPAFRVFSSRHTSRLVRPFAEAWSKLMKDCYDARRSNKLSDDEFKKLVRKTLGAHSIKILKQNAMTYHDGFRDVQHPNWALGARIFHGNGTAQKTARGFIITADKQAMRENDIDESVELLPALVRIACHNTELPKLHENLVCQLNELSASGDMFKWFVVGEMKFFYNPIKHFAIIVSNLDLIYIKPSKPYQKPVSRARLADF